jgi:uncharacterized FAD-dependent dehydrogenase
MVRVTNIKLSPEQGADKKAERRILKEKAAKRLRVSEGQLKTLKIAKKSLDARDKRGIFWLYSVDVEVAGKKGYMSEGAAKIVKTSYAPPAAAAKPAFRPVVVGAGPAGLFAAYVMAAAGLAPIIIERGKAVEDRAGDVAALFERGELNPESNVHFGEGGAGAFSDGKLTAGIKDPRAGYVFETLVRHHAPEEILYQAKPHIGTDQLVNVLKSMRAKITESGGEFRFGRRLAGADVFAGRLHGLRVISKDGDEYIETRRAILAVGNSARDTFEALIGGGLEARPKPLAVGLRIEHRQADINAAMHGQSAAALPPAAYHMTYRAGCGRGVYTFCMCPGGFVIPAATETGRLAVNGMSYFRRDGENANSAILVSTTPDDFGGGALGGVAFQRRLEEAAFGLSGGCRAPVQTVGDFLKNAPHSGFGRVVPTYRPGVVPGNLRAVLGEDFARPIAEAIEHMNRIIDGFSAEDAILTGVETRTSSPITIPRDTRLFSNISGLIPCGEGAGHAGGIVSAAVDGVKCAEAVILNA